MTNVLSLYLSNHHDWASTFDYMRALDPAWVNIHQPTARDIHKVQQIAPNARIMLRSWDIDDHNGDRKREMYADPRGAARKHLEMWASKLNELHQELQRNSWSYDAGKWYLGLVNEPDPAYVPQVVAYSLEAMRLMETFPIPLHLGVVASSVGTFAKPSENDHGWTQFIPLERPINDGGHVLLVHEYWQPEGPRFGEDAGNLAWRHHSIPLNVPILIREAGANGYIYGRHSQTDDAGWQRFMSADTYAAQVREYIEGCDTRVQGVCLYMTDYHSDQWRTFDTTPAHRQLLAIADARPQASLPEPLRVHLPSIGSGTPAQPSGPTATINVPAGANIRTGPGTSYSALGALPNGTVLQVVGKNQSGEWWHVLTDRGTGWVSATVVRAQNVNGVPVTKVETPQPQGDNFRRCLPFILRWEGSWADDPRDSGGATMKGITIGTYTRWREAHGQPAPSKDDLRNISDAEVEQIYFEWYWKESGSDKLAWPLCLANFNISVNGGPGRAKQFLDDSRGDFLLYMAMVLDWYTKIDGWKHFGAAWTRRSADVLREATK